MIVLAGTAWAETCEPAASVPGGCLQIRGRASLWNGNPTLRIWRVGTRRILGVRDGTPVPERLQKELDGFTAEVFGDFVVCPLTRSQPGRMQMVCVRSAENLVVRRDRTE